MRNPNAPLTAALPQPYTYTDTTVSVSPAARAFM